MKLIITDIEHFSLPVQGEHRIIRPGAPVRNCIGCFGCWIKTPGTCVIRDGYESTGSALGRSDEVIFISRCCYGGLSPFVKSVLDRAISFVHPDFILNRGETHHKRRYDNHVRLSVYFYGDSTAEEQATARALVQANADNFDCEIENVRFVQTKEELAWLTF